MSKLPNGFAWIAPGAAKTLADEFPSPEGRDDQGKPRTSNPERTTALAIYGALTLLSTQQHRGDHTGIVASRVVIAKKAGTSVKTLDAYLRRMERRGLVLVERRRAGMRNLESVYSLPSDPGELSSLPPLDAPGVGASAPQGVATPVPSGGEMNDPRLKEGEEGQPEHRQQAAATPPPLRTDSDEPWWAVEEEGQQQLACDAAGVDFVEGEVVSEETAHQPIELTGIWAEKAERYAAERADARRRELEEVQVA